MLCCNLCICHMNKYALLYCEMLCCILLIVTCSPRAMVIGTDINSSVPFNLFYYTYWNWPSEYWSPSNGIYTKFFPASNRSHAQTSLKFGYVLTTPLPPIRNIIQCVAASYLCACKIWRGFHRTTMGKTRHVNFWGLALLLWPIYAGLLKWTIIRLCNLTIKQWQRSQSLRYRQVT